MQSLILVLALAAAAAGPELARAREAARLLDLSDREISLGDYAAAMRHGREAAKIFEAIQDRASQARALNRVGTAAIYAGDYAEAALSFQTAADLSSAAGDREGEAKELGNLGNVHFFLGHYSDAARSYDAAMALVEKAQGAPWALRRRRIVLVNKAALMQRLGRDQEALAIYQALGGQKELSADEQAQLLVNRGVLYRRLGDPVKALQVYDDARRLFARDRHVDGELGAVKNRGIVLALDLQQLDAAERTFSEVIDLAASAGNRRELLHAYLYRGETRLRQGRPGPARQDFVAGLSLAGELKTPEEEWKALYGLGRSEPEQEKAREYLARAVSVIEQVRERIRVPSLRSEFFNDKTEVFDALIAARLRLASAQELFSLLEQSHSRAWRERLSLSQPVDLPSVQRALPEGVLLLDYWSSPAGSALVAATRTRAAIIPVSVDAAQVKALTDALASGADEGWREMSGSLATRILPPAEWFEGIEHVIVVTAGALTLVPFELLDVGDRLLIQRAALSYAPTAAVLLRPAPATPRWSPPWHLQLRAFADPVFGDAALDDASSVRGRLTASAAEVRAIASELAGAAALHLGGDNLKAHLVEPAEQPPILHVASHAFAGTEAIEQSRILFSPANGESTADYLFLKEAYELPLVNVELAVLSACDTERGTLVRGEGVQSFSRAFLAAGARSTVTTLWRVADAPTARFMEVFYHHLQSGLSRDEALRRAKLRFLESGSVLAHPHYWAAFVLTGDALRPVPRAIPWTWVAASAMLAGVLVVTGRGALRRRSHRVEAPGAQEAEIFTSPH